MRVTSKTSQKLGNELPEKVTAKDRTKHKMCIVPAPFSARLYIKNASNFLAESTSEKRSLKIAENTAHIFSQVGARHWLRNTVVLELFVFKQCITMHLATS